MKGPCLCGDPCCPHCGNPEAEKLEEAIEGMLDTFNENQLSAGEYQLVEAVGLAAVLSHRDAVKKYIAAVKANEAEARMFEEMEKG